MRSRTRNQPVPPRWAVTITAGAMIAYAMVLVLRPGGTARMQTFGDLALVPTPSLAAGVTIGCALRLRGSARWAWLLIGAGCASWAAGQVIWCWYELVAHRQMPYPSLADVGYLGFLPLTVAGSTLLITARSGKWRTALDAMIISGSLLAVSWAFVLGPVVAAGGSTPLEWIVGLAYPLGDIAMMTMSLLVLGHVRRSVRLSVWLLAAGAFALSVAHGLYAYQVIRLSYVAGTWVDAGWFGGFLLVGLGALAAPRVAAADSGRDAPGWVVLPYVPLGAAVLTSIWTTVRDGEPGRFLYCLTLVLVALVVTRQLISARDNLRLARTLGGTLDVLRDREAQLEYLAFHDPLTGLANRALFEDRTRHAIAHQDRSGEPMALIYIDLDGFKTVNDELGHHAGDLLLVQVADRLAECIRASDTLARVGGDEFVVLCERMRDPDDDAVVAGRIVARLAEPFDLNGAAGRIGASVGIARRAPKDQDLETLMRTADDAMYSAKAAGKGRFVVAA